MRKLVIDGKTIQEDDKVYVDGEMYYTLKGAMDRMLVGRNTVLNSIKDGTLEVFIHPIGKLFHPDAIREWVRLHTIKCEQKKKK